MTIRVATYNLENLFTRPAAMNSADEAAGRQAIEDHAAANAITTKEIYSDSDKEVLVALSRKYGWHRLNPPRNALVQFQKIRGRLFSNSARHGLRVAARGRDDWTGWFELRRTDVTWRATFNTARVIAETRPDILILVEVENRPTFERFNEQVLRAEFGFEFPHFMIIDGNDERGIDVGLASRFPIVSVRPHVDDGKDIGGEIFSRDCPEYDVLLPGGGSIVIIPNHFKSKRNGNDQASRVLREAQAIRANQIARSALSRSEFVLVGGDLNDTPTSTPIGHIFEGGFRDVMDHEDYPADRPGTFRTGLAGDKIDYLVNSPALWSRLVTTGLERRGTYHPGTWQPFDTVTSKADEASDHHLVWGDYDL